MRHDLTIKTGSLSGTSEFRVIAPIKTGFVPALDTTTYKTRVKRVLRALQTGRVGAQESELFRVLSDAVSRVGRIHSVSITLLEPQDHVIPRRLDIEDPFSNLVRAKVRCNPAQQVER